MQKLLKEEVRSAERGRKGLSHDGNDLKVRFFPHWELSDPPKIDICILPICMFSLSVYADGKGILCVVNALIFQERYR